MKRQLTSLQPFPFASDFTVTPQAPETEESLNIKTEDLAALLNEARTSTAELVRDETLSAEAERLSKVSEHLTDALKLIVSLAELLESAAIDEQDRQVALENVRRLASSLIDGQTDMFSGPSSLGNHSV